jgi:hypothetical protein
MAQDRFGEYAQYYSRNQPCSWSQAQAAVDASHEPAKGVPGPSQYYMSTLDEDERMGAVFQYAKQAGVDVADAATTLGYSLDNRPVTLDASGLAYTPQSEHYARQRGVSHDHVEAMLAAAANDGFSEQELAHMRRLIEVGHDAVSAYVSALETRPAGQRDRKPRPPMNPMESQPTAPESHTGGSGHLDADFVADLGTTALSSGPSQTGPYHVKHIPPRSGAAAPQHAFKHGDGHRKSQGIPQPEPGGLSPQGYERRYDYERSGLTDEEYFCRRFGCDSIVKRPSGDGGEFWEPADA